MPVRSFGLRPSVVAADNTTMTTFQHRRASRSGFTLIEVLLVVMILGVLASIALPVLAKYQLKSKTAEGKTNLGAIRVGEQAYFSEFATYLAIDPEPAAIPGAIRVPFDDAGSGFADLGFDPEGTVFFSYGVGVSADGKGFTADAGADIDGNGLVQFWGYTERDSSGALVPAKVGCPVAALTENQVGPCDSTYGQSVF